jgi:hypothetical protein
MDFPDGKRPMFLPWDGTPDMKVRIKIGGSWYNERNKDFSLHKEAADGYQVDTDRKNEQGH